MPNRLEHSSRSQFSLRSLLIAIAILASAIVLAKYNIAQFQQPLSPRGPLPWVGALFMLLWILAMLLCRLGLESESQLMRTGAFALALGAFVAAVVNAFYWLRAAIEYFPGQILEWQ